MFGHVRLGSAMFGFSSSGTSSTRLDTSAGGDCDTEFENSLHTVIPGRIFQKFWKRPAPNPDKIEEFLKKAGATTPDGNSVLAI